MSIFIILINCNSNSIFSIIYNFDIYFIEIRIELSLQKIIFRRDIVIVFKICNNVFADHIIILCHLAMSIWLRSLVCCFHICCAKIIKDAFLFITYTYFTTGYYNSLTCIFNYCTNFCQVFYVIVTNGETTIKRIPFYNKQ